ncbi:MAG: pilin [Oscillospiraceae bacterium]|nr:pilin [Oscillospiraceae bacterium]
MKGKVRSIAILLLTIILIASLSTVVMGTFGPGTVDSAREGQQQEAYDAMSGIMPTVGRVLQIIRNVGVILAVIIISVLGIKFILGSAEEKAEYKKSFIPLIIGILVLVAAVQIATMIFNLAPQ